VLPTRLPLDRFYRELVDTQRVLFQKHMNWRNARGAGRAALGHLLRGQTNFVKSLFKFNSVYNVETLLEDHALPVRYQIPEPPPAQPAARANARGSDLYIHPPRGRISRATDDAVERFVDETRMGAAQ
jgi:hypothetical protein